LIKTFTATFTVNAAVFFRGSPYWFSLAIAAPDRGRLARNAPLGAQWYFNRRAMFALRAHCGRDARDPLIVLLLTSAISFQG
jgi:hypothetical protein